MEKAGLLLISGGKTTVVFQFEKEILYQMPLFVGMPVYIPGCLCTDPAGNDCDASPLFYPSYKTVAVVTFVCKYDLAIQVKGLQQFLSHADIILVPSGE